MDIISIEYYTTVYYYAILTFTLLVLAYSQVFIINSYQNVSKLNVLGYISIVFVIAYMGARPLDEIFTDMPIYANKFSRMQHGYENVADDLGFSLFMYTCSKVMSVESFFMVCSALYVFPLVYASKRMFRNYWFIAFLMLIGSLSFWSYGVNGIRNGIATSFFLMALAIRDKRWQIPIILLSITFHKTMVLPALALTITHLNNDPRKYMVLWLLAIPFSLILGSYWENLFASFNFIADDRISYLTANVDTSKFAKTGFRWDFVLYSATGLFAGYFYIIKKAYRSENYHRILNVYLITNIFWILIIRANFSNRFAYLSWFMLAIVIIYPLLSKQFLVNQYRVIGLIVTAYFLFTLLLNVILTQV